MLLGGLSSLQWPPVPEVGRAKNAWAHDQKKYPQCSNEIYCNSMVREVQKERERSIPIYLMMIYWSILGENINALVYGKYCGWIHRILYNPVFLGFNRQTLQNGPSDSDPNQNRHVHIAGVKILKVLQVTLTHHPTIVYCLSSASHISRSLQKCLRDTWAPVQECLYFASFACRIPS